VKSVVKSKLDYYFFKVVEWYLYNLTCIAVVVFSRLVMLCSVHAQILDWDYYIERLGNAIQKIITIPAALQAVLLLC